MVQYKGQIDRRKWLYLGYGDHSGGYTREITQNGQNLSSQASRICQNIQICRHFGLSALDAVFAGTDPWSGTSVNHTRIRATQLSSVR